MIRKCIKVDTHRAYRIINEPMKMYEDMLLEDRYQQPYLSMKELEAEIPGQRHRE